MDDSERTKLELADHMIKKAVDESLTVKPADAESEARLKSIRQTLLDAQEQIAKAIGPD